MRIVLFLLVTLITTVFAEAYVSNQLLEKVDKKYGKYAKNRFMYLEKTLGELKDKNDTVKLEVVNNFFNDVRYTSDIKNYKKKDYWATPWEFLGRDKGDCEDYVIAKYFALKYLGVDGKKLYFSYVKSTRFKAPHMVLTYFETPKSVPLVLDNTNFKIFPATARRDLIPIYNFNGDALYLASKKGNTKKVKQKKSHKKWDKLLIDIENNKL